MLIQQHSPRSQGQAGGSLAQGGHHLLGAEADAYVICGSTGRRHHPSVGYVKCACVGVSVVVNMMSECVTVYVWLCVCRGRWLCTTMLYEARGVC